MGYSDDYRCKGQISIFEWLKTIKAADKAAHKCKKGTRTKEG